MRSEILAESNLSCRNIFKTKRTTAPADWSGPDGAKGAASLSFRSQFQMGLTPPASDLALCIIQFRQHTITILGQLSQKLAKNLTVMGSNEQDRQHGGNDARSQIGHKEDLCCVFGWPDCLKCCAT